MVAVRPAVPVVPPRHILTSEQGHPSDAQFATVPLPESADYIFILHPSAPLPAADLSQTPVHSTLSQHAQRVVLRFVRNHFYHFVWYFRFGISCFVAVLFVKDGLLRNLLIVAMIPAHASLVATALFLSCDILKLLAKNYDFWFATIINTLNWIALGVVLSDKRVVASILGWFGMQTVITVDASYRTFPTSVASMRLAVPIVLVLFGFVSLRSIDSAHFFKVIIDGHHLYDAADIMGFTSFTLAILLAKIMYLKKRRVAAPRGGIGYLRIPCAQIRVTLRLDQTTPADSSRSGRGNSQVTDVIRLSASPMAHLRKSAEHAPTKQRMTLSPLKITHIDARRTLLPRRYWQKPGSFLAHNHKALRTLLYTIGAVGFGVQLEQSARIIWSVMKPAEFASNESSSICGGLHLRTDPVLVLVASALSTVFCGLFALFYQRDLLRLLFTNFDYIFSIVQITAYEVCVLDMVCWDLHVSLVNVTWLMWLVWALTIDALTPLIKKAIFLKVAAAILAGVLVSGLSTTYFVIFVDNNGLRYRTIVRFTISSTHTFALTTKSVLLGRAATISLWCTRQVVALCRRSEGELHLIRGLVEYESPYGLIPPKFNKHPPAFVDDI